MAAALAVVVSLTTGAMATRALAATSPAAGTPEAGRLIGMSPSVAGVATLDKNSTVALKQLLQQAKSGVGAKMGPQLYILQKEYEGQTPWHDGALSAKLPPLKVQDGYVRISAYGDDVGALKTQPVGQGMLGARLHDHAVTGRVPVVALGDIAAISGLKFVKPALVTSRVGLTTTQGDRSMRSDLARAQFGVDGSGVRVGVLSDSFDCAPGPFASGQNFTRAGQDAVNGDLPLGVRVLADLHTVPDGECTDEGRAMMQIIHDVAPGASLSFTTAVTGEEDFAAGILALANDGAKVIVDDVEYLDEPMFEDGVVAEAVDQAVARGVAYFSAAGNEGRQSYQAAFRSSGRKGLAGARHNFASGGAVSDLQHLVAPPGTVTLLSLQWDQPSFSSNGQRGSQSDVDAIFYNMDGTPEVCLRDACANRIHFLRPRGDHKVRNRRASRQTPHGENKDGHAVKFEELLRRLRTHSGAETGSGEGCGYTSHRRFGQGGESLHQLKAHINRSAKIRRCDRVAQRQTNGLHSGSRDGSGTMGRGIRSPPASASLCRLLCSTGRGWGISARPCGGPGREFCDSRSSSRPKIILPAVV